MRRRAGLLAAPLLVAVLLSGCAGKSPTPQDAAPRSSSATAPTTTSTPASESAPSEQQISVEFAAGQVTGDTGRVTVEEGSAVVITILSDVADEAHLHGYDLETELSPGVPAELRFDATIPGVFELELHEAGTVLLTLQVG